MLLEAFRSSDTLLCIRHSAFVYTACSAKSVVSTVTISYNCTEQTVKTMYMVEQFARLTASFRVKYVW
jgi:hypothetical protein